MYNICWPNRICTDKWNVYQKILLIKVFTKKKKKKNAKFFECHKFWYCSKAIWSGNISI